MLVMAARFTSSRFIGRERELARLGDALERAVGGRGATVLVTGSAGIGVSRLIHEAERRVAGLDQPFTVIPCTAHAGRAGVPFGPVVEGLRELLGRLDGGEVARLVDPGADALSALLPEFAGGAVGGPGPRLIVSAERRHARLLEAIHGLLERLAESAPVLLVIEDLHAADAATRSLAAFVSRITRGTRVCLIATYQPDEMTREHPLREELIALDGATRRPERIDLDPLSVDELANLVTEIEGERPTAAALLLLAERSRGVPLLVEELVAARRELSGVALGLTLDEIVVARLARLKPASRRVLRLLAPAREPLRLDVLAAAWAAYGHDGAADERSGDGHRPASRLPGRLGARDRDLVAALAEVAERGLIAAEPASALEAPADADGATLVDVRHTLIARAIERDLLPGQRQRNHAALAIALEGRPDARARQWLAAHEPVRARDAALEAAAAAETLDAPADALAALELAMELGAVEAGLAAAGSVAAAWRATVAAVGAPAAEVADAAAEAAAVETADGDAAEPAHVLARAAEAAFRAGRAIRAGSFAEAAVARLDAQRDRLELGRLYGRLGRYRRIAGDHDGALAARRRAVAVVPPTPSKERAEVLAGLAQELMLDGRFSEAEKVADEAISMARAIGVAARAHEGHALCTLGIARAWGRDPEGAVGLIDSAHRIAVELGRLDDQFRATANLTTALELVGRRDEAIEVALVGIEEARRSGLETVFGNFLRGNVADVLFSVGRWAEAVEMSRTALEWSPAGLAFVDAAVSLATVQIELAADDAGAQLLGRLLLELETVPDPQYVVPASRAAASFALWRGDPVDAARLAELGWGRVSRTEDWVLSARMAATALEVQAALVADAREHRDLPTMAAARERAGQILADVESALHASGVGPDVPSRREAEAYIAVARAFRQRVEGRDDPASWEAVAATWQALGNPYQVARARWRQAEALLAEAAMAREDARVARANARPALLDAYDIARRLGALPLIRELAALAVRAMIILPDRGRAAEAPAPEIVPPAVSASWGASSIGEIGGSLVGGRTTEPPQPPFEQSDGDRRSPTRGLLASAFTGPLVARRDDVFGLSRREREVLSLIVDGRTNREIGERLFISQKTVGVHVGNILSKLGVSGRVEAATVALRLELLGRG